MKLLLPPDTTEPTSSRWLVSVATTVRMEKERSAYSLPTQDLTTLLLRGVNSDLEDYNKL